MISLCVGSKSGGEESALVKLSEAEQARSRISLFDRSFPGPPQYDDRRSRFQLSVHAKITCKFKVCVVP